MWHSPLCFVNARGLSDPILFFEKMTFFTSVLFKVEGSTKTSHTSTTITPAQILSSRQILSILLSRLKIHITRCILFLDMLRRGAWHG